MRIALIAMSGVRAFNEELNQRLGHPGKLDQAFALVDRAYQTRSAGLVYLHLDPGFKPLRGDPRDPHLVGRIGLK